MILGLEIVLTLLGFWMLCTGKGWGKNAVKHWQFRLLGAVLITLVPVVFGLGAAYVIVCAVNNPGLSEDQLQDKIKWPVTGIEFGVCILYGIIGAVWESKIRKKVAAENTLSDADLA